MAESRQNSIIQSIMKVADILFFIAAIAFIIAVYYADSPEARALLTFCANMCGVAFGVRFGLRLRNNQDNKE